MARMPRLVVPGLPHHLTQRGSRRMRTFFRDDDYRTYLKLLAAEKADNGVAVWAYCLMPNHVHLVVVPEREDGLARLFRAVHQKYSRHINMREDWRGHLWQERFHSFVMDERYLLSAVRYTEMNPVRAGLCIRPQEWPWSSARAHLAGRNDSVVEVGPMLGRVSNWSSFLGACDPGDAPQIRTHANTGRPAGDDNFVDRLEMLTGRELRRKKPGRKPAG